MTILGRRFSRFGKSKGIRWTQACSFLQCNVGRTHTYAFSFLQCDAGRTQTNVTSNQMLEGQTVSRESTLGLTTHPAIRATRKLASSPLQIWSFFLTYGPSFIGEALALPSTRKRVESRPPSSLTPSPLLHQWIRLKSSESFPEAELQRASVNPLWVPRLLMSQTPWVTPYVGPPSPAFLIPSPLLEMPSVFLLLHFRIPRTGTSSFRFFPPTTAFNALIFVKYQNEILLLLKHCYCCNKDFRRLPPQTKHL